jgi:hypothetical protein
MPLGGFSAHLEVELDHPPSGELPFSVSLTLHVEACVVGFYSTLMGTTWAECTWDPSAASLSSSPHLQQLPMEQHLAYLLELAPLSQSAHCY